MEWFEAIVPYAFVRGLKLCRVDKDLKSIYDDRFKVYNNKHNSVEQT